MNELAFLMHLSEEIYEIKCHLSNQRLFEGGFGLGEIYRKIDNRIKDIGNGNQLDDDEEDDEEEEECLSDYQELYESKCEEIMHLKHDKLDFIEANESLKKRCLMLDNVLRTLISRDHIFKSSLDEVINLIVREDMGEKKEDFYKIIGKENF